MLSTLDWLMPSLLTIQSTAATAAGPAPWWTGQQGAWVGALGGSSVGLLGAILGPAMGVLVPKGKGRSIILPALLISVILGACIEGIGLFAVIQGQPYHVWYPLVLIGGIAFMVMLPLFFLARSRYRAAEINRMQAQDLLR